MIGSKRITIERITREDLPALATGAGILGTGGGGSPRIGRLRLETIFADDRFPDEVEIVPPEDVPDDWTVTSTGGMGAPTISVEKTPHGDEELRALRAVERASGRSVDAIIPGEIGGANSMAPLVSAAQAGLPVVDGDGMGRAFPELQMDTFFVYGQPVNFAGLTDERGNEVVFQNVDSPKRLEDMARKITVQMGGRAGYAFPLMDGDFVAEYAVGYTISLAVELGRRVHQAREMNVDPVEAACDVTGGRELFAGKIVDVFRRNRDGFAKGQTELAALDGDATLSIDFQNEFLIARDGSETPLAVVPDLICIVDAETAAPVTTSALRYGQRVRVLGIPAPELLRTPAALSVIGPGAFGYEVPYEPLDGRRLPIEPATQT